MPDPSIFTNLINSYFPEPHASLFNGILFGVSLKTSREFYMQLKMVGLLHLVVLSGMNITLLASFVAIGTEWLGKKKSTVLTILIIIIFILFVRPQAPIIRAGFMGILTFVSIIYGRKPTALYLLFLSALFIAIFWPGWITSISFQLSFGATLGIILFYKKTPHISKTIMGQLKETMIDEFRTSLSAQVFTAPLIFLYFKQVSTISPLANVLVSFVVAPLMIFGFIAVILGSLAWGLGYIPSLICYGILHYIVVVVELLSKVPFGFFSF